MKYKNPRQITGKMRARVFGCVTWPESMDTERIDRLITDSQIQAARSPLHGADTYTRGDVESWLYRHKLQDFEVEWTDAELMAWVAKQDTSKLDVPWIGDLKKEHYHWVVSADGSKSYQQMYELFGGYVTYFEKVESKRGALKYLIHKNNPEKAQYSFDDIKTYGGMDVSSILQIGEVEQMNYISHVEDYIFKHNPKSYIQLVRWGRAQDDLNVRKTIQANQYHFKSLLYDLENERARARRLKGRGGDMLDAMERAMRDGAEAGYAFDSVTGELVMDE